MVEAWRPVVGWEGLYLVSDKGRVRSLPRDHRPHVVDLQGGLRRGYLRVRLSGGRGRRRWRPVHQLVLEAFHGPRPPGMQARHLNGDRTDNTARNLAWGYLEDNVADKAIHRAMRENNTGEKP